MNLFVGRHAEMAELMRCRNRALEAQPWTVLLEGAPGIGKSALLVAFAGAERRTRERGRTLLLGAPREEPYDPVRLAALQVTRERVYERIGGRAGARELLVDWIGVLPGVGDLASALAATADALRRRRRKRKSDDETVEELLVRAGRHPLVLLFDDLHLAAATEIARLQTLASAAEESRLLIVAAYRPAEPGEAPAPAQRLAAMLPADRTTTIRLGPLAPKELDRWLAKWFLHPRTPDGFVPRLHERTGGYPGLVEATVQDLLDREIIRFVDRHWEIGEESGGIEPPTAPAVYVLDGLPRDEEVVVRAASLLGAEFDALSVSRALGLDELEVEDRLALCVRRGLLRTLGEVVLDDGEITTRYRFASPHVRSALHHSLPRAAEQKVEGESSPGGLQR